MMILILKINRKIIYFYKKMIQGQLKYNKQINNTNKLSKIIIKMNKKQIFYNKLTMTKYLMN